MITTIQEIYRDTRYFFIQKIGIIFVISVVVTFVGSAIELFIKPSTYIISVIENQLFNNINSINEVLNNLNATDKQKILKYSIFKMIELLTNKTLLLGSIITLINLSSNKKKSISLFLKSLFKLLPNLFLINIISLFIIQISYCFFIIPGIIFSILLILSPIIFSFKKNNLIGSITYSIYLSAKYIKIIGPAIILWICGKFFLTAIVSHIILMNKQFSCLILNISTNIIYSILTIFLFRFYMLFIGSKKSSKNIDCII